jgi:hypothetical protein
MGIISKPIVTDDRGRSVSTINGYWLSLTYRFRPDRDRRLTEAARRIDRERVWVGIAFPRPIAYFVAALLVGLFVPAAVFNMSGFSLWLPPLFASWAALVWWTLFDCIGRSLASTTVEALLQAGRCASCGYLIDSLGPSPDGCVVCPECGAAWKSARVTPANLPLTDTAP